jgi:hypothetical protein
MTPSLSKWQRQLKRTLNSNRPATTSNVDRQTLRMSLTREARFGLVKSCCRHRPGTLVIQNFSNAGLLFWRQLADIRR